MRGTVAIVLFLLFTVVCIALSIWVNVAAPCDWIDWMPAADTPARCFR